MKARDLLIHLSLKYDGDWHSIYHAIKTREKFDVKDVEASAKYAEEELAILAKTNYAIVTVTDEEYPEWLKSSMPAPFVLYLKDGEIVSKPFKGLKKPEASPKHGKKRA